MRLKANEDVLNISSANILILLDSNAFCFLISRYDGTVNIPSLSPHLATQIRDNMMNITKSSDTI